MRASAKRDIRKGAATHHIVLIGCGLLLPAGPSFAAEPLGEWLVDNKSAHIKVENCDGALWGVVSWEAKPGGRDTENPDAALKSRPTLGIPILLEMKESAQQRWEGHIYNVLNGKTYSGNIRLLSPDVLKIEGCLFTGFLCGGEEWTRVSTAASPASPQPKAAPKAAPKGGGAAASDVCSRVSNLAGRPH